MEKFAGSSITDWLMLIITAVYVVATIFICVYNNRGVHASLAQIREMQKEYESTLRINTLPCISVFQTHSLETIHATIDLSVGRINKRNQHIREFFFLIKNTGHDIASEISYGILPERQRGNGFVRTLTVNESRGICLRCLYSGSINEWRNEVVEFYIVYKDIVGHTYTQTLTVAFLIMKGTIQVQTYFISVPTEISMNTDTFFLK